MAAKKATETKTVKSVSKKPTNLNLIKMPKQAKKLLSTCSAAHRPALRTWIKSCLKTSQATIRKPDLMAKDTDE